MDNAKKELAHMRRRFARGIALVVVLVIALTAAVVYLMMDRAALKRQLEPKTWNAAEPRPGEVGSGGEPEPGRGAVPGALDLTGEWIQPTDSEYCHIASIHDDVIEIYWYIPAEDYRELYWWGSFQPPETVDTPYSWTSTNDLEMAETSPRASREEVKTFTYKDGKLSYLIWYGRMRMSVGLERWDRPPEVNPVGQEPPS